MKRPDRERLLTREQSRVGDSTLMEAGVPGIVLMENAGRGAADHILRLAKEKGVRRTTILVGTGQNGGDGLVVARHLALAGLPTLVFSPDAENVRGGMREAWEAVGGTIGALPADLEGEDFANRVDVDNVVDAMFGTGITKPLSGRYLEIVTKMNERTDRPLSIALDLPSGLDVDSGTGWAGESGVFRATHTLTFGTSKPGLHTGFGRAYAGEVLTVGIGAPVPVPAEGDVFIELVRRAPVPPRRADAHKGENGRVLVVGGSAGQTGAALLCARGAHRAGAGLVTIASRAAASLESRVVETMTVAIPETEAVAVRPITENVRRSDVAVIGPGLGRDIWAEIAVRTALDVAERVVLDADALGLLPGMEIRKHDGLRVLTPHPLEMARLLGMSSAANVNAQRIAAARSCAERFGAFVVLKGPGTVIQAPDGRCVIVDHADATLGVAGSGDVLAGAIGARLAEKDLDDPFERIVQAVVAHARTGQILSRRRGAVRGVLASEIADALSAVLEGRDGDGEFDEVS